MTRKSKKSKLTEIYKPEQFTSEDIQELIKFLKNEMESLRYDVAMVMRDSLTFQKEFLTLREAAVYFGCSLSMVQKEFRDRIPAYKLGRRVFFKKSDLDKYVEKQSELKSFW